MNEKSTVMHDGSGSTRSHRTGHERSIRNIDSRRRSANPDDPPVRQPPYSNRGVWPGPNYLGLPGRTAIVQGQVFLVAAILITQLWLVTDALLELLSGRNDALGWLALASGIGFVIALVISFWPRRSIEPVEE